MKTITKIYRLYRGYINLKQGTQKLLFICGIGGILMGLPLSPIQAQLIYHIDANDGAFTTNLTGGAKNDLVSYTAGGSSTAQDIEIDKTNSFMYVLDQNGDELRRYNLSGGGNTLIYSYTASSIPYDIEVDVDDGKIYHVVSGEVFTTNLTGGSKVSLITYTSGSSELLDELELDLDNNHMYIQNQNGDELRRYDLNGGSSTLIYTYTGGTPRDFVLDISNSLIYHINTVSSAGEVFSTNLTGGSKAAIISFTASGSLLYTDIELDQDNNHMYILNSNGDQLLRFDTDGTNQTTIYTYTGTNPVPRNISLDLPTNTDTNPPVFESSTPSTSNITASGFTLSTDIDEAGVIYYVVVADGATAPTSSEVKAGTASGGGAVVTSGNAAVTSGAFTNDFSVVGLASGTAYDVYVVAEDDESTPNLMASSSKIDVTTIAGDMTSPSFENSTPSSSNITTTSFTLSTDIDEAGMIYYVVIADEATAPTSSEVKAGTASGGGVAVTSGNAAVTSGGFTNDFSVVGLASGTAYDVYVVAEDDESTPNLMGSPTKIDVTLLTSITYDFEDMANNATSFTTSATTFNFTGFMIGQSISGLGSDSPPSDAYFDSGFGNSRTAGSNLGGFQTANCATFQLKQLDVWPSTDAGNNVNAPPQDVIVSGYLAGVQQYSVTLTSTDYGQNPAPSGGKWHRITLSAPQSTTNIDEVRLSFPGASSNDYIAVDNFVYSDLSTTFPEINVVFGGTSIASSGTANFGAANTVTKTITIQNTGSNTLSLTGSPIVNVSSGTAFAVSTQPSTNTIAGNSSLSFEVTYTASAVGATDNGAIQISNSDCDEGTYTINLTATGINETTDDIRGSMCSFDGGTGRVTVGDIADYKFGASDAFTLEAWMKLDAAPDGDGLMSNRSWLFQVNATSISLFPSTSTAAISSSATTWTTGTWYHVAASYDFNTGNYALYIDGMPMGTGTTARTPNATTEDFIIGAYRAATDTRNFPGSIDEVRIWNVVRTQQEIRDNMHLTLDGDESGLLGYYQFNSSGATITENMNGYDGTLTGGAVRANSDLAVSNGTSNRQTVSSTGEVSFTGTSLSMEFAAVSAPGSNDEFVAYQMREGAFNTISTGAVTSVYWIIRRIGTQTFEIDEMTFTIPSNNEISTMDEGTPGNLKLYKRGDVETGSWTLVASAVSASNTNKQIVFGGVGNELNMNTLSQFIITSSSSALPITLLSFDAKRQDDQYVLLQWSTAQEINNKGFEIEMSEDNLNFETVAFVDGAGNTNVVKDYELRVKYDNAAYYRLKQIDFNGEFTYSDIRFVEAGDGLRSLSIIPNPSFEGHVRLDLGVKIPDSELFMYQLVDMQGKILISAQDTFPGINKALKDYLKNCPKGVYLIQLNSASHKFSRRLILE